MKKAEKNYIETELNLAMGHLQKVWKGTGDFTPEDAILTGIMTTMMALFRILNKVKTED